MRTELLSPGGSPEAIRAAVNAGADAVYAGGRAFGARAYAENPDPGELLDAIDYCHLHGAKLYLTVNTLLKEHELEQQLYSFLLPYYERGVDAVLVQDFGVFRFLKRNFPDLPLHASTQMTVTGADGAILLQRMGAERVVLSRELSLDEIRAIREKTDVELETFVHGALCYCYSGQCLMSSVIGGRSGNRGRCAQPCRLPYDFTDAEGRALNRGREKFLLSLRDIRTLRILPDLIDAGIASLKIEGRMKSPEYAAGITSVYRKYIDLYEREGLSGYHVDPEDERLTEDLFSRGPVSEGSYFEKTGRERMLFTGKKKEDGASLRRTQEQTDAVRARYVGAEPPLFAKAQIYLRPGERARLMLSHVPHAGSGKEQDTRSIFVTVEGEPVQEAKSRPMDEASVKKQLAKTGDTPFRFDVIDVDSEGNVFLPVSSLNALRREGLEKLRGAILAPHMRKAAENGPVTETTEKRDEIVPESTLGLSGKAQEIRRITTASVLTREQLKEVLAFDAVEGIYLDGALFTEETLRRVKESGRKAYLVLPAVWRREIAVRCEKLLFSAVGKKADGVLLRSFDQLEFLSRTGYAGERIADTGLYTWNRESRAMLRSLGVTKDTLPAECSERELKERGCSGSEWIIYGRQTVMVSAHCLTKNTAGCRKERGIRFLKDRTGARFPVLNDCLTCTNLIFNSVLLDLREAAAKDRTLQPASLRYCFTTESGEETRRILEGGMAGSFTRGAFRKGVE